MSEHVELIREAARLIRQRAEAATKGPWTAGGMFHPWEVCIAMNRPLIELDNGTQGVATAEHIASWHPGVALLVADWLELEADMAEKRGNSPEGQTFHALALSRAIVGKGNENG